jgi:prevent-host-death family protein
MQRVSIREARRQLSALCQRAELGHATIVTRRGRDVAVISRVPARRPKPLPDLSAFRAGIVVRGEPLSAIVARQRREARY